MELREQLGFAARRGGERSREGARHADCGLDEVGELPHGADVGEVV